jgi:transposase
MFHLRIGCGRKKEEAAKRRCKLTHPESVQAVSMDMRAPCKDAVEEVFPKAAAAIDLFSCDQAGGGCNGQSKEVRKERQENQIGHEGGLRFVHKKRSIACPLKNCKGSRTASKKTKTSKMHISCCRI